MIRERLARFARSPNTRNATALGSLIRPRAVTRCNLAVSDMYMRDFGNTHKIAYTYCSVGISDLKPLTGTSADQLPHMKSRSLATLRGARAGLNRSYGDIQIYKIYKYIYQESQICTISY